jgi:hypothetical protein
MATLVDFGSCAKCGYRNAKCLKRCRHCDTDLPWAVPSHHTKPKQLTRFWSFLSPWFSWIDWGLLFLAMLSFSVPFVGLMLFRVYSNQGHDGKAALTLAASMFGLFFYLSRFFMSGVYVDGLDGGGL